MADDNNKKKKDLPTPPSPPPKRLIKEDIEIKKIKRDEEHKSGS